MEILLASSESKPPQHSINRHQHCAIVSGETYLSGCDVNRWQESTFSPPFRVSSPSKTARLPWFRVDRVTRPLNLHASDFASGLPMNTRAPILFLLFQTLVLLPTRPSEVLITYSSLASHWDTKSSSTSWHSETIPYFSHASWLYTTSSPSLILNHVYTSPHTLASKSNFSLIIWYWKVPSASSHLEYTTLILAT